MKTDTNDVCRLHRGFLLQDFMGKLTLIRPPVNISILEKGLTLRSYINERGPVHPKVLLCNLRKENHKVFSRNFLKKSLIPFLIHHGYILKKHVHATEEQLREYERVCSPRAAPVPPISEFNKPPSFNVKKVERPSGTWLYHFNPDMPILPIHRNRLSTESLAEFFVQDVDSKPVPPPLPMPPTLEQRFGYIPIRTTAIMSRLKRRRIREINKEARLKAKIAIRGEKKRLKLIALIGRANSSTRNLLRKKFGEKKYLALLHESIKQKNEYLARKGLPLIPLPETLAPPPSEAQDIN